MPTGTFRIDIVERRGLDDAELEPAVKAATTADLELLAPLLVDVDQARHRIEVGDICAWTAGPEGTPAGVFWVNTVSHMDRFLGKWTRPTPERPYINQLFVLPELRMHGYGNLLMRGVLAIARGHGASALRSAVSPANVAATRLHSTSRFVSVASVYGVRVGRQLTLRISRPSDPRTGRL